MNKYDSYKDSGVEWIGEIPKHWEKITLKYLVETKITDGPHETPEFVDEGIPFLSVESVQDGKLDFDKKRGFINREQHELYSKKCKPQKDDIFIVKSGSTTGKSTIVETDLEFNIWSPICIVRPIKKKITPRFTFQSVQSEYFRRYIELGWSFGTQPNIGMGVIENLRLIVPPLSEQTQIVQYLDNKTTLIDTLIQKTQEKINLLREKRTSLINHTVTKGLNPDVEMKDSGVEWIGEIPKHWEVKKLKHIVDENVNSLSNSTDPNYELDYIEISDVDSDGKINNTTHYIFSESPSRCRRIVQKGDIILSTVRTYLRSIGIIDKDVCDLICSTGFSVLTPKNDTLSKHLFYMLRTEWFISDVISKSEGVSYPSIQSEKLRNINVVTLPIEEQQQIVEYLNEQNQLIDTLIQKEEKRVELLKEYRQTLISDLVTGKIKVTDYE